MPALRLLAVDDQQEILDVIELAITTTSDWSVTTRRSAAEAADAYDGTPFDVVLLDVNIPGEQPAGSVHALRAAGIGHNVLLLTGAPVDEPERRRIGADGVLSKPFDPVTLTEQITTLLASVQD